MSKDTHQYEAPVVTDFGDLMTMTLAQGFTGAEDGGSKMLIHHDVPVSAPSGP